MSESPAPGEVRRTLRDDLGLSIDMLDADRLRNWAHNLETHGTDVSYWGSTRFLVEKMRSIADGIEEAVRDIGTLRAVVDEMTEALSVGAFFNPEIAPVRLDGKNAILEWRNRIDAIRSRDAE